MFPTSLTLRITKMIDLLMIYPLVAGALLFVVRRRWFDLLAVNLYAVLHIIISCMLVFSKSYYTSTVRYFAVDGTNRIFLLVLSVVFLMSAVYNNGYIKHIKFDDKRIRFYMFMLLIFIFAMTGTTLSTNLGVAWVFVEATTLATAYLIYFNRTRNAIEAAWKYVFICSIGIALAFVGIILLNISTCDVNTLYYSVLYSNAFQFNPFWLKAAFVFMVFGFGTKMGLAPVHFWLPDAHSESPSPISALLSATLLNSAFLIILRVLHILELAKVDSYGRLILLVMGFASLFVTAVYVSKIKNYKRMLAYSSVENMGILAIGTAIGGPAMYAVMIHLVGHSLAKASFFLTSGNILELYGTKRVSHVTGLVSADSLTGWLWVFSFLAICAFPTSALFISEFLIIKAMFAAHHYILCAILMLLLTIILFGFASVVFRMSFGSAQEKKAKLSPFMYVPQLLLLAAVFILGVYIPQFLNNLRF